MYTPKANAQTERAVLGQTPMSITRRHFLQQAALAGTAQSLSGMTWADQWIALRAAPAALKILPIDKPVESLWAYNNQYPGPALTVRQGEELRVRLSNALPQPTTVHWHGIRVPNAMDGVPGMTQDPVSPGGHFDYRFHVADAGTYWYHPHVNTFEQIGRGLAGALVVQEREAVDVDEDWLWVLTDQRLDRSGRLVESFGDMHDAAHAGRIGNVVFINGSLTQDFSAQPYSRVRLRLVAATSARIFSLRLVAARAWLWALDGHPVPAQALSEPLTLAPGQRADVLVEIPAQGEKLRIQDVFYGQQGYELATIQARGEARTLVRAAPKPLPPNPLPQMVHSSQAAVSLTVQGGAMSREATREAIWLINGKAMKNEGGHAHHPPLFRMRAGQSIDVNVDNQTMWHHPLHFHGVWLRRKMGDQWGPVRDTIFLQPREKASLRIYADQAGQWMVHCHVLGHQAHGMMGHFEVA